jgi:hAT family C-terminal dimerisation region
MAMDYLPIQASSVPAERIFSSSAETDTKKRNRINSLLMEALQVLKFHLKQDRLNFTDFWMTSIVEMEQDDPEGDLLGSLIREDAPNVLDGIIRSMGADET